MRGKTVRVLLMALFLVVPSYFLLRAATEPQAVQTAPKPKRETVRVLEGMVRQYLPLKQQLQQIGLDLRLFGGHQEQNGIFISEEGLMRDIKPPLEKKLEQNNQAISDFAQRLSQSSDNKKNTYLVVVPNASGVLRQNLPRFAQSQMIDQQRQIESIYKDITLGVRTVDAYSALQSQREQYIYYRTEDQVTALGGYYIYTAIARRLGINVRSLNQFSVEYVDHEYYGSLYQLSSPKAAYRYPDPVAPYRKVQPDVLSLYNYNANREYLVTHIRRGGQRRYHTLYPRHLLDSQGYTEVYLGGSNSAVTQVSTSSLYSGRLLIYGDDAARMCLPYLVSHYQQITLVNLLYAGTEELSGIYPEQFDHVLFIYGIENYIHTDTPSQVCYVHWREDLP